jgi:outer membrane protein assembly factor BamB
VEIRKDPVISGGVLHDRAGASHDKKDEALPADTFSRAAKQPKGMGRMKKLAADVTQAVLKPESREPVTVDRAAHWSHKSEDRHSIEGIYRTPSGNTFVCCHSFDTENRDTPRAYTVAYDSSGRELWKFRPDTHYSIDEHLFSSDGSTYIACNSEERWDRPSVTALNADGTVRWKFQPDGEDRCTSIRLGPDGTLYAKMKNTLYAVDGSGNLKWKHRIGMNSDDFFHEMTPGGTSIFANDNFSNNFGYDMFYSVDSKGKKKELDLPDIGTFPIHDDNGHIFYGGEKGEFYGINPETMETWKLQLGSERGLKTPHWGPDGRIYVEGRFDKGLYAIDPQGKLLWRQEIDDARPSGMGLEPFYRVAKDGSVYYARRDKEVIQQIDGSGNRKKEISVNGGFSDFAPDSRGNVLIRRDDDTIVTCDVETDSRFYFPMELARNMDMKEVLDDGSVVFQDMCDSFKVTIGMDQEVKKKLEELTAGDDGGEDKGEQGSAGIEVQQDWVIIGDVKLPRK